MQTFAAICSEVCFADEASFRCLCPGGCFNAQGTRPLTRFSLGGFQVPSNAANAGDNRR
ncbi:hypothetical protein DSM117340_03051 [Lentibacter algarum]